MPQIILPSWEDLREVVTSAEDRVLICTPYYSSSGIGKVFDAIGSANQFKFWTKLSPSAWAAGVTSPEDLLALADLVRQNGQNFQLAELERLHAKIYAADYSLALIGSANLSDGGFRSNLELLVKFVNEEAQSTVRFVEENFTPRLRYIDIETLRDWIDRNKPIIMEVRSRPDNSADDLHEVQRSLDEILGYGQAPETVGQLEEFSHDDFGRWLEVHLELPGADVLSDRYKNTGGQNLTGHFKQSFFGIVGFLSEHKEYIPMLTSELEHIDPGRVYDINPAILEHWLVYFNQHATQSGNSYDFAILRGILPPSVGGTRYGGGGGISTFKRVLPLVAQYLSEMSNGE